MKSKQPRSLMVASLDKPMFPWQPLACLFSVLWLDNQDELHHQTF